MRTAASTRGVCALGCAMIAACTASAEDVRPPSDQLFFPSGLVLAPDDSALFVSNANSELRYDSGTISVIDLTSVTAAIAAWTGPSKTQNGCTQDTDHRETLICDAKRFMKLTALGQPAAIRIGNFSTDIAMQDFSTKVGGVSLVNLRVFAPTRGDPSVTWADYNGDRLSCTAGTDSFALCDDAHRLQTPSNDLIGSLVPDEPFNVFADATNGFAIVTHLTNGAVALIDSRVDSVAQIADVRLDVFAPDQTTGLRGATGVSGRIQSPAGDDIVYVGSRTEDRIQTFTVIRPPNDSPPYLAPGNFFFLDSVSGTSLNSSTDTRGVKFSPNGDRLYVVNRRPPTVQIFDTSNGPDGLPRNLAVGASDICMEASTLTVVDAGAGERAYITCFQDGTVYVVDPRGTSQVEDIITVGRGPFSVAASPALKKLFISNFLEDTVAVVDVDPLSATKDRVVLRIGIPRAP